MKTLPKVIIISIITLAIGVIPACDSEEYVPYVYVSVQLYPDMPAHMALKTPGNYLYVDGQGYKGIVVACTGPDEWVAYDRACPHHPKTKDAILSVDSTGLFLECPICSSKFNVYDGSIVSGPSKYTPLVYTTTYQGSVIYISNSYY